MEKQAEIANKYIVCTAFFVDDNRKFADVEYYVVKADYEDIYNLAPRFVLSDGSKVDAQEYVQEGFDDLIKRLQDMTGSYDNQ